MAELGRIANEYRQLLGRERQVGRWAAGKKVDGKWTGVLMKEQQVPLEAYKRGGMAKVNQVEIT